MIFQQSGLLSTGGKARGFVRSLATGRFPNEELDKFVAGEESLVDQFLNDTEFELADIEEYGHQKDDEVPAETSEIGSNDDVDPPSERLPIVNSKAALKALDSAVLASTDAEALDFLIASAKAKVWTHTYRDPDTSVKEAAESGASEYSRRVREEFLAEFREASQLDLPPGYTFVALDDVTRVVGG